MARRSAAKALPSPADRWYPISILTEVYHGEKGLSLFKFGQVHIFRGTKSGYLTEIDRCYCTGDHYNIELRWNQYTGPGAAWGKRERTPPRGLA